MAGRLARIRQRSGQIVQSLRHVGSHIQTLQKTVSRRNRPIVCCDYSQLFSADWSLKLPASATRRRYEFRNRSGNQSELGNASDRAR